MKTTLLTKLFPSRQAARRTAGRRPARLGLEAMDDRSLPSASASLAGGVVTINCDQYSTTAQATYFADKLVVSDAYNGIDLAVPAGQVQKIVYNAGSNPGTTSTFKNLTGVPGEYHTGVGGGAVYGGSGANTFFGGTGPATCYGGTGTNTFFDSAASLNDFEAGVGDNVLYRAHDGSYLFTDWAGARAGAKTTVGLLANPYQNPGTLNAPGLAGITAYLDAAGKTLTLAGPTGGGFQLDGNWTDTRTPAGGGKFAHSFTASGAVQLETGILAGGKRLTVPLPSYGLVSVTTKPNTLTSPVGEYNGLTFMGGLPLTKDTNTGGNAFTDLLGKANLSFNTGGLSWGVKLGSDPTLARLGMPLLADVPYLYATTSMGVSASFGGHLSAGVGGYGGSVVFDPADPAVYVQAAAPAGTFSGGVSLHSAIPYTPARLAPGANDPYIFGNLYASGAGIALGELPLAVSGSVVIGLDANHDGKLLAALKQSGDALKGLISGDKGSASLSTFAGNVGGAANDIAVGLNGGVALTTSQYGVSLSADVASGSVYYTPNPDGTRTAAFDVGTVNPFAGTVLAKFAPASTVDVGGWLRTRPTGGTPDWGFTATAGTTALGGFTAGSLLIEAGSATYTAHAHLGVQGMLGAARFDVDGTVNLRTGDFDLTQTAGLDVDAQIASMHLSERLHFGYHGGVFEADAHLHGTLQLGTDSDNLSIYVDGDVDLTADRGAVHVRGHGDAGVWTTSAGHKSDPVSVLGFDFDDHGFGVSVLGHGVRVGW